MLEQARTDLQHAQAFDMTVVVKNKIGRCHDCADPGCDFLQTAATVNLSLHTPSWPRHCIDSASVDLVNLPCRPLPSGRIADHPQNVELWQRIYRSRLEKKAKIWVYRNSIVFHNADVVMALRSELSDDGKM